MSSTGSARKRERENPCGICGHYHKYEEGEACGICGHRMPMGSDNNSIQVSAFPSEILPEFLYLGSYDNASRSELLKTQGISRIVNTVPTCQNLFKNSFSYYCLQDDKSLQFEDVNKFLEQCEKEKARVLVYCMSGKSRSPAIVIAFLMKSRGWRLAQSYQWVKERRPAVALSSGIYELLEEFERKLFGSTENSAGFPPAFAAPAAESFSLGFSENAAAAAAAPAPAPAPIPTFNTSSATTIFAAPPSSVPADGFTFGAGQAPEKSAGESPLVVCNQGNANGSDMAMDGA